MKAIRFSEDEYAALLKRTRAPAQNAPGAAIAPAEPSKYHNEKSGAYASKKEAARADELRLLERSGAISELREQVRFELVPAQYGTDGKLIERACTYVADFTYIENGELVVEDVKSEPTKTAAYRIKRKLLLWVHGVRIREVGRGS